MIVNAKRPQPRPYFAGPKPALTVCVVTAKSPQALRKERRADLQALGTELSPRFQQVDPQFEAATAEWKSLIELHLKGTNR